MPQQTKVEGLMQSYAAMTPAERLEFRAMLTGYDLSKQTQQSAGKKAAATKKAGKEKTAEAAA